MACAIAIWIGRMRSAPVRIRAKRVQEGANRELSLTSRFEKAYLAFMKTLASLMSHDVMTTAGPSVPHERLPPERSKSTCQLQQGDTEG